MSLVPCVWGGGGGGGVVYLLFTFLKQFYFCVRHVQVQEQ